MSRSWLARGALVALLVLTLASWWLADQGESAGLVLGAAMLKVVVVGAVFLELTRSYPVWGLLYALGSGLVLGLTLVFLV